MPEKARELEQLLWAAPGAEVPGYGDRGAAELGLVLSLGWAGWTWEQCFAHLKTLPHGGRERTSGYRFKTVNKAFDILSKDPNWNRSREARRVLNIAGEMAIAAIITSGKTSPDKFRLTNQVLRVLGAHLELAARAANMGRADYFAPRRVICELAQVNHGAEAEPLKYIIAQGWIKQIKAPVRYPDNEAGIYQLRGVPKKGSWYKRHSLKAAFVSRNLLHFGASTDLHNKLEFNSGEKTTGTKMQQFVIGQYPLPSHPAFAKCHWAWFAWRLLIDNPGLRAADLAKRLGVNRSTAGRQLEKLAAAGFVRRIKSLWYADASNTQAEAPVIPATPAKPEPGLNPLGQALAPKPLPRNVIPFEGAPPTRKPLADIDRREFLRRQKEQIEAELREPLEERAVGIARGA